MFITLQYIPAPDQLNRLKEYEKDYDSLAEAEQFAISISGIKRLVPRLKSLVFRQRYPELVQVWILHIFSSGFIGEGRLSIIKIGALGASPSQPSPLTEDLN